nr:hypothetical protein [Tanacetum cinerariifolium]
MEILLEPTSNKLLVDLPNRKRAIGTKWGFRNKKDEKGIVIRNKVRLVAQGYTQEEVINYDEVFAPAARIEAIKLFLDNGFQRGKIDKTLFIKRHKGDILLVQVYVNDIIFGSTKTELCNAFKRLMHDKFQMSSMVELSFFLGLQMKQKKDGTFISQDKYVAKILKKFRFIEVKTASTPMETQKPLLKDEDGEEVDVHMYRSTIGSLMYLTSLRPDIMFVVCACTRYQVNLKYWSNAMAKTINEEAQLHAKVDGKKIIVIESSVRRDLQLADVEGVDCLPNSIIFKQH